MALIVGLGNPGDEYANTRHNIGFRVVDELARRSGISLRRSRLRARVGTGQFAGQSVILLQPQTYMNDSGAAVRRAVDFYHVELQDLLVVYDDFDLPLGQVRIRQSGSAGGHNGMRSVIQHMRTDAISRLRIGVGEPGRGRAIDHVLGAFRPDERPIVEEAIARASDAVARLLEDGLVAAMNHYNS